MQAVSINKSFLHSILETQPNFRDLGGIETADGRSVKPGLLFRSGDLFSLSDSDIQILEGIKLALVIDFRAPREVNKRPNREISTIRQVIHLAIPDTARDAAEKYFEENNAVQLRTLLIGDYRRMIRDHVEVFREFLHIIATTQNLPLVFHCAAGKDRTGLASVFLLSSLGIDLTGIWKDYMATNRFTGTKTDKIIRKVSENGLNGEILRPLLEVRKEYLEAALDEIDNTYGGIELFVRNELRPDIKRLQARFTG